MSVTEPLLYTEVRECGWVVCGSGLGESSREEKGFHMQPKFTIAQRMADGGARRAGKERWLAAAGTRGPSAPGGGGLVVVYQQGVSGLLHIWTAGKVWKGDREHGAWGWAQSPQGDYHIWKDGWCLALKDHWFTARLNCLRLSIRMGWRDLFVLQASQVAQW